MGRVRRPGSDRIRDAAGRYPGHRGGQPNWHPRRGRRCLPGAAEALVHGVLAAAAAKQEGGLPVAIGFAVVPEADPGAGPFWPAMAALGGAAFAASVDFAGVDMYPDVFGRIELGRLDSAVGSILGLFVIRPCRSLA